MAMCGLTLLKHPCRKHPCARASLHAPNLKRPCLGEEDDCAAYTLLILALRLCWLTVTLPHSWAAPQLLQTGVRLNCFTLALRLAGRLNAGRAKAPWARRCLTLSLGALD